MDKWDIKRCRAFSLMHEGYVYHFGTTGYTAIHDASVGTIPAHNDDGLVKVGQKLQLAAYYIWRGWLQFNTYTLPSDRTIVEAYILMYLKTRKTERNTQEFNLHAVGGGGLTNPIDLAAYGILGQQSTSFGSCTIPAGYPPEAAIVIELNAAGIATILPGAETIFGLRIGDDINSVPPAGAIAPLFEYTDIYGRSTESPPKLLVRLED